MPFSVMFYLSINIISDVYPKNCKVFKMNVHEKFYWSMFYMKILQNSHLFQCVNCCLYNWLWNLLSVLERKLFQQPILCGKLHVQHLVFEEFDESSYRDLLTFDHTFGVLANLTLLRKHGWDLCELNWLLFSCREKKSHCCLGETRYYFILRCLICNSFLWDLIYVKMNIHIWQPNGDVLLQISNVSLSRYVVHLWLQGLWGGVHGIAGHQVGCSE